MIHIRRHKVEERFLASVRDQLLTDDTLQWAEREIAKAMSAATVTDTDHLNAELADVERSCSRVIDAICKVGSEPSA
jgi:hypothetical protein